MGDGSAPAAAQNESAVCRDCGTGQVASNAVLAEFVRLVRVLLIADANHEAHRARADLALTLVGHQLPGRCFECAQRLAFGRAPRG